MRKASSRYAVVTALIASLMAVAGSAFAQSGPDYTAALTSVTSNAITIIGSFVPLIAAVLAVWVGVKWIKRLANKV